MSTSRFPIPQGTLDMLILKILSLQPAHGYGIAQRVQQVSRHAVQLNQGSFPWLRSKAIGASPEIARPPGCGSVLAFSRRSARG